MMDYQNDKDLIKISSDPLNISFENLSYSTKCGYFSKSKSTKLYIFYISTLSVFFNFLYVNNKNNNKKQLYDFHKII